VSLVLSIFSQDILPIFVVAGVGFLLARRFGANVKTLSTVAFNALSPCLVFDQLVTAKVSGAQSWRVALFCVLLTVALGVTARLAALPLRLDRATLSSFLLVVMFSNSGNYALPVVLGVNIPAHVAAISVLSLYGGAFYAEIVRGSIESIHRGQWDSARALGLRPWHVLRLVIIPQALKPMLAPYVNQSITQLKNTSLVSIIAVPDLVYNATLINADTYRPLEVYTIVALIYFAILFPATLVARRFERGLTYDKA